MLKGSTRVYFVAVNQDIVKVKAIGEGVANLTEAGDMLGSIHGLGKLILLTK
ncbi:hypothetical protein NMG60_11036088 [Bertholletia excelsa]